MVVIICPPVAIGLNDLPKSEKGEQGGPGQLKKRLSYQKKDIFLMSDECFGGYNISRFHTKKYCRTEN